MRIFMVTSESLPFSKTGGLGDVVYSLSKEYAKMGEDISIIVPYYEKRDYKEFDFAKFDEFECQMNWRKQYVKVYLSKVDGIKFYLLKNEYYFGRDNLYGYFDDGERFAFFQNACLEFLDRFKEKVDILHCHDWQTGMIPVLVKEKYRKDEKFLLTKTVFTIHNPLFKGFFDASSLTDFYGLDIDLYNKGRIRLDNQVSTLKAGIVFADKITTVSPTHAYELTTKEGSFGLWFDMTLREKDFLGILNGVDYDEFDPETDKYIVKNYSKDNYKDGKYENKVDFCKEFSLDPKKPLYGVVSRLTDQKGLDLIFAMADDICSRGGNFAVCGSGEKYAEDYFNFLKQRYPHNVAIYIGYNNAFAHKIYASSDFFIMPSKFEPCGIGQMIAHRYGTLPIVRATGGLKDSVLGYNGNVEEESTFADGFSFSQYSILDAIKCANETFDLYESEPTVVEKLIHNAFNCDHSWHLSATKYLEIYNLITK